MRLPKSLISILFFSLINLSCGFSKKTDLDNCIYQRNSENEGFLLCIDDDTLKIYQIFNSSNRNVLDFNPTYKLLGKTEFGTYNIGLRRIINNNYDTVTTASIWSRIIR